MLRAGAATLLRRRESGIDQFLDPRRGLGQIAQRYYEAAHEKGARFEFGARVTAIESDGQQVKRVSYEQGGQPLTGGGLRLSLPPKSRFQQPLSNRPNMIREPRRHRGTAMPHAA
ncbi:hypothetical protein C2W62_33985 [Candidatus Entotheonella serta]|nr:hypothetical protein C2W62_33985 [Candidatus Entotheonella serta]